MTLRTLLETLTLMDHSTPARFPDGSGGQDKFTLVVSVDGHGNLLSSTVRKARLTGGMMFIAADGKEKAR